MNKFIVSSVTFGRFLDKILWNMPKDDIYELKVKEKTIRFGKYSIDIEPNKKGDFNFEINIKQVERLRNILRQLEDQPIVCGITSEGWFSINQIVL